MTNSTLPTTSTSSSSIPSTSTTSTIPTLINPILNSILPQSVIDFATNNRKEDNKLKRKLEKDAKKESARLERERNPPAPIIKPIMFLPRKWGEVDITTTTGIDGIEKEEQAQQQGLKISLFTWNMLAQCLVRRELFPGSDFLSVKDRSPTLMAEVCHYSPDVACLQEVDRLDDHIPILSKTHGCTTYIGYPTKNHGLVIAHKDSVFTKVGERGFRLDEQSIISDPSIPSPPTTETSSPTTPLDPLSPTTISTRKSTGLSRSTRNVALFVALKFKDRKGGIIVGTTHLFWHPQHVYERVRQTGILMREIKRFRDNGCSEGGIEGEWKDWETFVAGDFNTQPREITYHLIKSIPLLPSQISDLERSTVVHQSVDKLYDSEYISPVEETIKTEEGDGIRDGNLSQHPDKVIKNSRLGKDSDGLVSLNEFKTLFNWKEGESTKSENKIRSAYGEIGNKILGEEKNWYVDRVPEVVSANGWKIPELLEVIEARKFAKGGMEERIQRGDFEPKWTNFTPLWRCTLDYIFLLPPSTTSTTPNPTPKFTALLNTHSTEAMGGGLPKKFVEPSDHIALGAIVELF